MGLLKNPSFEEKPLKCHPDEGRGPVLTCWKTRLDSRLRGNDNEGGNDNLRQIAFETFSTRPMGEITSTKWLNRQRSDRPPTTRPFACALTDLKYVADLESECESSSECHVR